MLLRPIPLRPLFLRLLGAVFFVAFVDAAPQVRLLAGEEGLQPARDLLDRARGALGAPAAWHALPTLFWLHLSDGALVGACIAGAAASAGIALLLAPRMCLAAAGVLYLSIAVVGRDFYSFQWDNLLVETALLAAFYAPPGWRPFRGAGPPPPHPAARLTLVWLLFRLHFESGVAKLRFGDPHWSLGELTAMESYYETAPLPTWLGWFVHQAPAGFHRASAAFTLAAELVVPFLLFGNLPMRRAACAILAALHLSILATANYFIFNHLSLVLCLPALERAEGSVRDRWHRALSTGRGRASAAVLAALAALSVIEGCRGAARLDLPAPLAAVDAAVSPFRAVNSYHLFAHMTLTRAEVEIQGSEDGETWEAYEFWQKPGDPRRAPEFVAPHQPRVDFRLWFLARLVPSPRDPQQWAATWGDRRDALNRLVDRLARAPETVAPLFRRDPFGGKPPRFVRLAFYRYRMTGFEERRASGAWWSREFVAHHPSVHDTRSGESPRF